MATLHKSLAFFFGLSFLSSIVVASESTDFEAAMNKAPDAAKQQKYLFFVSDKERKTAQAAADKIVQQMQRLAWGTEKKSKNDDSEEMVTASTIYREASKNMRKRFPEDVFKGWMQTQSSRGKDLRRSSTGVLGGFKRLPNIEEDQEHVIVTYDVMFDTSGVIYTEQFTLVRGEGGSGSNNWVLDGYYIAPKPYYEY